MLDLSNVMLCAIACVNVDATVHALRRAKAIAHFGDSMLFTDANIDLKEFGIQVISIDALRSSSAYSHFVLTRLRDHVTLAHCLIVQWDGFPMHPEHWNSAFLDCDYIGAPWPQFSDGYDVGNGGFSLRSRRLMDACCDPAFKAEHPEDVAICRLNRPFLEGKGLRFASKRLAAQFSSERSGTVGDSFGFHGVFNMIDAVGAEEFWQIYQSLDDRGTVWHDAGTIARQLSQSENGLSRSLHIRYNKALTILSKFKRK